MFELANPWVLLALPLPLLVWFLIPKATMQLQSALKVPFYDPLTTIVQQQKTLFSARTSLRLLFLIWSLILFAMAGPRWVGEPEPLTREGRNLMLALDLSGSMELNDMLVNGRPVSRLTVVKQAAKQFVQERVGDRIGLILFGTRAYLQTPLTYDRQNVLDRLEDSTAGLAGQTTSIGDAIGLAVKRLEDVSAKSRLIILLTDGANNSGVLPPLKAAELAKLDGIKIYTIGLGAESDPRALGAAFFNPSPSSDLDEATLKDIAQLTGGQYFRATDTQSLKEIYNTINELETVSQEEATVRPQLDYYTWPLSLAFLLLLYWFFQRANWELMFASKKEALKT